MTNREQAIRDVTAAIGANEYDVVNGLVHDEHFTQGDLAARYAVDTTEKLLAAEARVLELEAALGKWLQACDLKEYSPDWELYKQTEELLQPKGE